jgi:hypothetical protein
MSALFQWTQHGHIRPMTPDGTKPHGDCLVYREGQPVLMGSGVTDGSGRWSLVVRPALCPGVDLHIVDEVSIVATPTIHELPNVALVLRPTFVTTAWGGIGGNLVLHVWSWDPAGKPAPNVPFSWHATVFHHLE